MRELTVVVVWDNGQESRHVIFKQNHHLRQGKSNCGQEKFESCLYKRLSWKLSFSLAQEWVSTVELH